MKPRNIELYIEELVLEGFKDSSRHVLGEAVERELSRLFAEQGVPPSLENGGRIDNLDGGTFELTPNTRTEVIGAKVAHAVYGGLKK